jgi:pseudouridine kinase
MPVHDRPTAEAAARRLVEMGAQNACITLGERGVCCADRSEARFMDGMPVRMTNATGAGDAFTAAMVWGRLHGMDLFNAARAGMAAAALAVESEETVNPGMTEEALRRRME